MTDPNGSATSVQAGNPEVGSSAVRTGGSGDGEALSAWVTGLRSEDNRAKAQAKGWRTPDDVVVSYSNLESQLGRAVVPPRADDTPEKWDAFYRAAGRPDDPGGYEFTMPEGLPEDFAYAEDLASSFRQWAHGSGLNPSQAQALHDRFVQYQGEQYEAYARMRDRSAGEAHDRLVDEWGDTDSDGYRRKVEFANRAIRNLGGDPLRHALQMGGLLTEEGAVTNAALAFALAKAGEALYAEDTLTGSGPDGTNPWATDQENLGHQGQILRQDPERARVLIRAAGLEPSSFGLAG
jgi:hypothetical protein